MTRDTQPRARRGPTPAHPGAATPAPGARAREGAGLGTRIFLATAGIVVVTLGATLAVAWTGATRAADRTADAGLARTRALVGELLAGRERALAGAAAVFAQSPGFVAAVERRDRDDALDQAQEAAERTGAAWVQVTDASGVRLARSDDPASSDDTVRSALVEGALDGRQVAGFGAAAGDGAIFQVVAVPVGVGGRVVGTLMATLPVDSALARQARDATGGDIVFYALDSMDRARPVVATLEPARLATPALGDWLSAAAGDVADTAHATLAIGGEQWVARHATLRTASGAPIGGYAVLRSRDAELAAFGALWWGTLASGVLGLLLAVGLSAWMATRIARPVRALAVAARRAAAGDYEADLPEGGSGEVRALADAVRTMLADLRDKQALVVALGEAERLARESVATAPAADFSSAVTQPALALPHEAPTVGRTFAGRYEILALLGRGGMGTVYKARDRELGEVVAIKTLRRDLAEDDPVALERFRSEIRLARKISHRGVVRTHDVGVAGGVHYITMEYVDGTPLSDLVEASGRLTATVAISIGKQLARALEAAHEVAVLHRDVKPHNLIVTPDGLLKVMDFGIAHLIGGLSKYTKTGAIVGTPAYMAPEQLGGEDLDARVDVYAAGVVLYECLTGRLPFQGESPYSVIASVLSDQPPPPRELDPSIPAALASVVTRAMAKERSARLPSASALHAALEQAEAAMRKDGVPRDAAKYPAPGEEAKAR